MAEAEKKRSREQDGEPRVRIQLFKDNEKYKDDLFVAVNGRKYIVKRGVPVDVPVSVAEVIEHSMAQDFQTEEMVQRLADEYANDPNTRA